MEIIQNFIQLEDNYQQLFLYSFLELQGIVYYISVRIVCVDIHLIFIVPT